MQYKSPPAWVAWSMWGLGALFFFAHYFVRVAPAAIFPELMRDFGVTASAMGAMAGFFYIAYVSAQIPLGILIDRFGVRILLCLCILLAAGSTYVFSTTESMQVASWMRFLFGIASASAFVSALKLATAWFPANRLALAVGLTQTLGMVGGMLGTASMASIMAAYHWRTAFTFFSAFFLSLALIVVVFVRNSPKQAQAQAQATPDTKEQASTADFKRVLLCPATWINALYCGLIFAPMQLYGEFWGAAYLEQVQAISREQAGVAISAIFVGWAVGATCCGWAADRYGRLPVMRFAALGGLVFIPLVMFCNLPFPLVVAANVLFGITNSGLVASYTVAGEMHSTRTAALALAIANMMTIVVGTGLNPLIGHFLDLLWATHSTIVDGLPVYMASDFNQVMSVMPLSLALAFVCTFFVKETLKK